MTTQGVLLPTPRIIINSSTGSIASAFPVLTYLTFTATLLIGALFSPFHRGRNRGTAMSLGTESGGPREKEQSAKSLKES